MEYNPILPVNQYFNQISITNTRSSQNQSDIQAEFQQVLSSMMFSQFYNPMSAGSGTSGLFGSDLLSPLLMLLMNNMEASSSTLNTSAFMPDNFYGGQQILMDAEGLMRQAQILHINQFDAEKLVGGDGANANCGPTALTIALHGVGLPVFGENAASSAGQVVDLARRSMIADSYRDGVDANGNRVEYEHNSYTNFSDLIRGANAAGAFSQRVGANAESIRSALMNGSRVIVSGTFAGKHPLPWTGDRGHDNNSAPGGATGHFVTITGYDPQRDLYIVNDPARRTPLTVTGSTLEYFMQGNAGALAVRRS